MRELSDEGYVWLAALRRLRERGVEQPDITDIEGTERAERAVDAECANVRREAGDLLAAILRTQR